MACVWKNPRWQDPRSICGSPQRDHDTGKISGHSYFSKDDMHDETLQSVLDGTATFDEAVRNILGRGW